MNHIFLFGFDATDEWESFVVKIVISQFVFWHAKEKTSQTEMYFIKTNTKEDFKVNK